MPGKNYSEIQTLRFLIWDSYSEISILIFLSWDSYSVIPMLRLIFWYSYPEITTLKFLLWYSCEILVCSQIDQPNINAWLLWYSHKIPMRLPLRSLWGEILVSFQWDNYQYKITLSYMLLCYYFTYKFKTTKVWWCKFWIK